MPTRPKVFRPSRPSFGRPARDRSKAERDAFYSSARWMRLRAAFLTSHPLCERCLAKDVLTPATIAHHKVERLARPDLSLDESNLEAICGPCHSSHHKSKPTPEGA